jgi:DnaJ like chaperone protein
LDRERPSLVFGSEAVALRIWGKILGGAAGFAIGGPLGAILGAAAGHAYDFYREEGSGTRRSAPGSPRIGRGPWGSREPPLVFSDPAETRKIAFATAVIVLGAKLSKVDGVVTRDEIKAFKRVFRIDDAEVGDVARIFDSAKSSAQGFEPYARQIAALFGHDPVLLGELLIGLFEIARADGEITAAETDFLRRVATVFGFEARAFEQVRARFSATVRDRQAGADDYAVLGLSRSASDEEIRRAYRKLVREHHPDRLVAAGMPEEMVEQANRVLAAINAAYDRIARQRKLR